MVHAMARAGGEVAAIPCPVVSGPRAATVHGLAGRRVIAAGEIVNVDLCGVYNRYHANLARCFAIGEPDRVVRERIDAVYGAVPVVAETVEPHLPVARLLDRLEDYYREVGLLGDEWWVGGYELGVAFPPDWVGGYIYSLGEDPGGEAFATGEVVNFEANFYLPNRAGICFCINTLMFEEHRAGFIGETPARLTVIE
jgi:Xaa-Pro aminopeptidase